MTALTKERPGRFETISEDKVPVAANVKCLKGALAVYDTNAGTDKGHARPAITDTNLVIAGRFAETVDNTGGAAGDKKVLISFMREFTVFYLENDTGGTPVTAADVGSVCFLLDDTTVTADATGRSIAGEVHELVGTAFVGIRMS